MLDEVVISLDAMGGDFGPKVTVPAAMDALQRHANLHVILVGNQSLIEAELATYRDEERSRVTIRHTSEVVGMDEPPAQALRFKKDSSMRVAIDLVKAGDAKACVSAGNTGALMSTARYVLKTLPGIDRPAICTAVPAITGHTHMLDLGANIDCSAEHLFQFAVMGSVLVSAVDGIESPRVGLLNIGQEDIKGNDRVKEAGRILSTSGINYIGNVEGDEIYSGNVDVVVCDGFVGNVSLKTSEGLARMITYFLQVEFKRSLRHKLIGLLAMPIIKAFKERIDPGKYNGASLLGLQGIVIKSHGSADIKEYVHAIDVAVLEVEKDVPNNIDSHLERHLVEGKAS